MILFDFDGVLADSLQVCLAACKAAALQQGVTMDLGADAFADLNPVTFEAFAERAGLEPVPFAAAVAKEVQANPEPSRPFPGITDMIKAIAQTHTLAVVSASHGDVVSAFLTAHGVGPHFQHVAGGNMAGDKTAKIKHLIGAVEDERHLFVGDAVSDIAAARAAGIPCCAVAWGWQPLERLLSERPDHVAHEPQDVETIARAYASDQTGLSA